MQVTSLKNNVLTVRACHQQQKCLAFTTKLKKYPAVLYDWIDKYGYVDSACKVVNIKNITNIAKLFLQFLLVEYLHMISESWSSIYRLCTFKKKHFDEIMLQSAMLQYTYHKDGIWSCSYLFCFNLKKACSLIDEFIGKAKYSRPE